MEFKFNSYNENYIMLTRYNILYATAHLDSINNKSKEEMEILKTLIDIQNNINTYERNMRKKKIYSTILDIAINKDSKLGQYILANQAMPKYIILDDIINALLVCINRSDWQYYEQITKILKKFKEENCSKIDYISFKEIAGEEITNYIINSKLYYRVNYSSHKNVHLYKNNKIILTKIPEPIKTNPKTKVKRI